jgi:type IV pilus assembly protein PilB
LIELGVINQNDSAGIKEKYSSVSDAVRGLILTGYDQESIARAYSQFSGIPFIWLDRIDPAVQDIIEVNVAKRFGFIPFAYDAGSKTLQAAFFDLEKLVDLNRSAISKLQDKYDIKFEFFVTSRKATEGDLKENSHKDYEVEQKEVDLSKYEISNEVLKKIPFDLANKFKAIIYEKTGDKKYNLAAADPRDENLKKLISFVEKEGNIKLEVHIAPVEQIERVLQQYQTGENQFVEKEEKTAETVEEKKTQAVAPETSRYENENITQFLGKEKVGIEDIKVYANSGRIPELVASTLLMAIQERASDVHIEPFEKAIRVRFRVDGELGDVILLPSEMSSSVVARVKILSKLKLDEQRIPQDGRFDVQAGERLVDIRVSTLPTVFGEKVVMRLLTKNREMEKLEDLGVEGLGYDRIMSAIAKPHGVVLSTGPTGSGKTTTLYSILTRLNKPQVNIITLEDPVEYELQGINQVQVKPQIGFGFADGLRSVLRQDPNIIMVGEIRDGETAELVTHAALTGHLVLSTLHTNDAAGALPRLFNLKVEPFLLTSAINAVIAQRLVRKICQKCREEISVPQSVIFEVKKELSKLNLNMPLKFYRGRGCSECKDGFSGRIGIFEVLSMTPEIENLVLNKKTSGDIFKSAVDSGMITMRQDGFVKALKGVTTVDEVLRVTSENKEGSG